MVKHTYKTVYICGGKAFDTKKQLEAFMRLSGETEFEVAIEEVELTNENMEDWPDEEIAEA